MNVSQFDKLRDVHLSGGLRLIATLLILFSFVPNCRDVY
jgi:hypothetical protein